MNLTGHRSALRRGISWGLGLALTGLTASLAQPLESGVSRGFSAAVVDRATGQRRWLIEGDRVIPVSKEVYEITRARLRGYGDDGRTNLVALTDRCFYNLGDRTVNSPAPLRVEAAEGQCSIEGQGFELRLEPNQLVLSNDVHAVLDKRVLAAARGQEGQPARTADSLSLLGSLRAAAGAAQPSDLVNIYSRHFNSETNLAVFRGDVRVDDPKGRMTCQSLAMRFDLATHGVESVLAKDDVTLAAGETRVTATEAVYDPAAEAVNLRGNPRWLLGERSGAAEAAVVELRTGRLHAWGNAELQLPPGSVSAEGAWLPAASPPQRTTVGERKPVLVQAEDFDYAPDAMRTNLAVAVCRGNVRVNDERGRLTCKVLTVTSAGPDHHPLSAVAEQDVTVEQGSGRVTCDRSVYDAATGTLEMTGRPAWQFADKEGQSDLLRMDVSNKVYQARGNVRMKAGSASFGSSPWFSPQSPSGKGAESGTKKPDAAPRPPVEVTCEEFEFRSAVAPGGFDRAEYRRHVQVNQGPEMNLTCDRIVASLVAGTNQVEQVVADGGVQIRSKTPGSDRVARGDNALYSAARNQVELRGPGGVEIEMTDGGGRSTARGSRAVYDGNRDIVELDGTPVLATPQGTLTGTAVRVDRSNSTFAASGRWKLQLPAKALTGRSPNLSH